MAGERAVETWLIFVFRVTYYYVHRGSVQARVYPRRWLSVSSQAKAFTLQGTHRRGRFLWEQSCTKILIFSTRFSCENLAVEDFVTLLKNIVDVCVCVVFSSHSFWTSSSLDVPAGVTQEEGHTEFLIHLLSAVHALIFLARRIQPFLSLVDREVEFYVLTI